MPQLIKCPRCERQLRVPEELLDREVKCPSCGVNFLVESARGDKPAPRPEDKPTARQEDVAIRESVQPPGSPSAAPEADVYDDDDEVRRPSRAVMDEISNVSTALMITGILDLCLAVCGVGANVFLTVIGVAEGGNGNQPDAALNAFSGVFGIAQGLVGVLLGVLIIVGAQKMKRLESYGLAMTSAIISVVPCHGCCLWGLPIGIWALVVLGKPEVKAAFKA